MTYELFELCVLGSLLCAVALLAIGIVYGGTWLAVKLGWIEDYWLKDLEGGE